MLETTTFLQDRHLYYLQCAMEEKCLAPSAYVAQRSRGMYIYIKLARPQDDKKVRKHLTARLLTVDLHYELRSTGLGLDVDI